MRSPSALLPFVVALALSLTSAPAYAEWRSGTISAVDERSLIVAGVAYRLDAKTQLVDLGGARVAPHELRPGTPVELEIGDDGTLVKVRATLVR